MTVGVSKTGKTGISKKSNLLFTYGQHHVSAFKSHCHNVFINHVLIRWNNKLRAVNMRIVKVSSRLNRIMENSLFKKKQNNTKKTQVFHFVNLSPSEYYSTYNTYNL